MDEKRNEEQPSFEDELTKLQAAVQELENQELTLEEAFQRFELGWKSYKSCAQLLGETKNRVEILMKGFPDHPTDPEDTPEWQPFEWEFEPDNRPRGRRLARRSGGRLSGSNSHSRGRSCRARLPAARRWVTRQPDSPL